MLQIKLSILLSLYHIIISSQQPYLQLQLTQSNSSANLFMKQDTNTHNIPNFITSKPLQHAFTINGPLITYKHENNKVWSSIFIDEPIKIQQGFQSCYNIRIVYTKGSHIMFGMTDRKNVESSGTINSCFMGKNSYVYNGQAGCIWVQGKIQHKTAHIFKQGTTITMQLSVGPQKSTLAWKQNNNQLGSIHIDNSKLQKYQLIPYIEMFQKWDQVEFSK